jgi:hypothetical protein
MHMGLGTVIMWVSHRGISVISEPNSITWNNNVTNSNLGDGGAQNLDYGFKPVAFHFKFNSALLKDDNFNNLVRKEWNTRQTSIAEGAQSRLVGKLSNLKTKVKKGIVVKKKSDHLQLDNIEEEIALLTNESLEHHSLTELNPRLLALESDRKRLLQAEEELWRLNNRATWILSGDKNTKYFHRFASFRRNKKQLWEVKDETDHFHSGQEDIKKEVVRHFNNFYKESNNSIVDQIATVRLYPRMTTEEEVLRLEIPCTKEEILEVLWGFTKDKSPGPDGWTVEFYLHYFDLLVEDLVEAVEESRVTGSVNRSINSTFLALIPKVNGSTSFGDFRPIALCNLCYKIITKIIANRIRPILSRIISEEQFGFLKGRQIIDAIGTTQECIHNIREKKLQAMILKIDLKKAYDCIS